MLTPQEVHDKTFPRASFGSAGYNMAAVEDFLDVLTEDYTSLYKENATLKAKLKVLAEKVEEYRATEDAMRSTLLDAQRRAAQIVQDAQNQRDALVSDARANAAAEIAQLDLQTQEARLQLQNARQCTEDYLAKVRALCQEQMERLNALPEIQPAQEVSAPAEEPVPEAAPAQEQPAQAEPALNVAQIVEEVVDAAEKDVSAEAEARKDVDDDFSTTFRLNLNDLKFGRNYSSEE